MRGSRGEHAIESPSEAFPFLVSDLPGETPLRQHFAGQLKYYEWHKQTGPASPARMEEKPPPR